MVDGNEPIETADELSEVETNCDTCLEKRNEKVKAAFKIVPRDDKGCDVGRDIEYLCVDCAKDVQILTMEVWDTEKETLVKIQACSVYTLDGE